MELTFIILVGIVFTVVGLGLVVTVLLGLPGAWMMLAMALAIELSDTLYRADASAQTFPWWLLAACTGLAVLGEVLEFGAGAAGASVSGSSRRGMIGALVGGIAGALLGVFVPMPLLGSLLGAVVGTFVGAIIGETSGTGTSVSGALRPATGASIGRVLGTLSEVPIAAAVWIALSIAAFWP